MRFLLDESADFPLTAFLQELGHDVTSIAHDYPSALKDHEVLEIALREARILITNDTD
jgi:predicted nuclease of predicted toxin-antitoxin system